MLGRFLARGLGGDPDPREARIWLDRALAAGVTEASTDLQQLASEPAQLQTALP
jgi:TPR repeat protein